MEAAFQSIIRNSLTGLFDVFPIYTEIEPYRDKNLNAWREVGAYNIISSTKSGFELQVNQREYGAYLFAEIQHLLNHAAEHRAHLISVVKNGDETSPSWGFVSLYYMSLFVAMAWTRISNQTVLYLDKDAVDKYCAGSAIRPGGGAYEAVSHFDSKSGMSSVYFKKCPSSHFHEAVWTSIINRAESLFSVIQSESKSRKATADELTSLRALKLFNVSNFKDRHVWPSKIRNAVNYRPGFSYRSVLRNNNLRTVSRLGKSNLPDVDAVITFGERAKYAASGVKEPSDAPNACLDLLIAQTLLMESIVSGTVAELCAIQGLSCSASRQRNTFERRYGGLRSALSVA
ncbi:hypothetical protein X994_1790 [Burkholderia pseudomallei]|uniref:hypothetical protein n=1 Tax=Burkholderia pseudomallei TaxID=28450 RepID=UPI00052AE5BB|nr:hypothetical protein [Burkholderia pseudomallei]AIV78622.1 hypothetical protein X994_1790 [Burkholderia pseudomallei]